MNGGVFNVIWQHHRYEVTWFLSEYSGYSRMYPGGYFVSYSFTRNFYDSMISV